MENTIGLAEVMTVEELAAYFKLHPLTVRRLARDGEIPAFKAGRQWRIQRDVLDAWMEEQSMQNLQKTATH